MGDAHYRRYGYGMADLISFLQGAGFETYVISGARRLRPIAPGFDESGGHELVDIRDRHDFVQRTSWTIES
jgi:hypothetical protein